MAITFSQFLSIAGAATVAGGVVGGGVIAYKNRDAIIKTFTVESPSNKPKLTTKTEGDEEANIKHEESEDSSINSEVVDSQPPKVTTQQNKPTKTEQKTQPTSNKEIKVFLPKVEDIPESSDVDVVDTVIEEPQEIPNSIGSSVLDGTEFIYLIAKFTSPTSNQSTQALFAGDTQNYQCQYEKDSSISFNNTNCQVFKLSSKSDQKELIEFVDDSTTNKVNNKNELVNDQQFLLKISTKLHAQITTSNKTIKLVDKTTSTKSFGEFSDLLEINKGEQQLSKDGLKSNIFTALVTKTTSSTEAISYENNHYKCKIGDEVPISCKFYKVARSIDKTNLDAVSNITAQTTDLAESQNILVVLEGVSKNYSQLVGKFQIFKSTDLNTPIVTGVADQLVIGHLNVSATPSKSNLFIPKDPFGALTTANTSDTTKAYIVTKSTLVNDYLQKSSYNSDDYICRVVEDNNKYDDDTCKVFPYPPTPDKSDFKLSDYQSDQGKVNSFSQLSLKTNQVIELKKALQDQLKKEDSALYLIRKDRKDKNINNQVVALTKIYDFTDEQSTTSALKTNLLLVRYKAAVGVKPTAITIKADEDITCNIAGESTQTKCKIYKFLKSQKSNSITSKEISELSIPKKITFVNEYHYVIELLEVKKGLEDIKNKAITISQGKTTLGNFEFDSLIFGVPKIAGLQLPREEVSYLVEQSNAGLWSSIKDPTSYRCKLPAPASSPTNANNFDFECKLVEIKRSSEQYINTFASVKSAEDKVEPKNLSTVNGKIFKIIFDKKLFYNFAFDTTNDAEITVEISANQNKKFTRKFKVLEQLVGNPLYKSEAKMAVFQVGEEPAENATTINGDLENKCVFDYDQSTTSPEKLDCKIYKLETPDKSTFGSGEDVAKLKVDTNQISNYSDIKKDHLYIIDYSTTKRLSDVANKTITFFFKVSTTDDDGTTTEEFKRVEFRENGYVLGELSKNKQLLFLKDPSTTRVQKQ